MPAKNTWREEVAKDIIWEFEELLCNNDTRINNRNTEENEFKSEDSYINKKDYNELKEKIIKHLKELEDYTEYRLQGAA